MLLTPIMATAGLFAALCQFAAHHLMRERHYETCVPRYVVGSAIVLVAFACGFLLDETQQPVVALAYLYGASLVGTRIGYATDPAPKPDIEQQVAYLDKRAAAIVGEHSDDGTEHSD